MKTHTIPAILVTALFTLSSCENIWEERIHGNGNQITETRTLTSFSQIQVNGDFEVQVDTGDESTVLIEADENLMDLIVTHVSGDRLVIETRDGYNLRPTRTIHLKVTTFSVTALDVKGSGYLYCNGIKSEALELGMEGSGDLECYGVESALTECHMEGSGNITCNLETENLNAEIEGSGEIRMTGTAASSELRIIGSGDIRASQLASNVCVAYISGSGNIDTHVLSSLDVTIIGSGMVYYSGNPAVESYISGSGDVVHQ
jgi:hypothetical protein